MYFYFTQILHFITWALKSAISLQSFFTFIAAGPSRIVTHTTMEVSGKINPHLCSELTDFLLILWKSSWFCFYFTCPDLVQTCPKWRKQLVVASSLAASLEHNYIVYWSSGQETPQNSDFDMGWKGSSLKEAVLWFLREKMDTVSLQVQLGVHSVRLVLGLRLGQHIPLSGHWLSYHCSLYLVERWTFSELPLCKPSHRSFHMDRGMAGRGLFPMDIYAY